MHFGTSWLLPLLAGAVTWHQGTSPNDVVQSVEELLIKHGKSDGEAHDKASCWCQSQTTEKSEAIESMRQDIDSLSSEIQEQSAVNSQLDIEVGQHQQDLDTNEHSLAQAKELRENDAERFSDQQQSHIQSIQQLDAALTAINGHHSTDVMLGMLRSITTRHVHTGKARGALIQLEARLQGTSSPEVISGVLKQMKTEFTADLEDMRQKELADKDRHEGLTSAKTTEINSLKKQMLSKKQRLAKGKVDVGYKQEQLDRSQKLLSAEMQLTVSLKAFCTRSDESFQSRQEAQQAALVALSSAQAELAGAQFLSVSGKRVELTSSGVFDDDGANLLCDAALNIVDRAYRSRAKEACDKAKSGAVQDAAETVEALMDDLKAAQQDASNKQKECLSAIHDVQEEASTAAEDDSAKAAVTQSDKQSADSQIAFVQSQAASADNAKTKLQEIQSVQHMVFQELQHSEARAAGLLRQVAGRASSSAATHVNEAIGHTQQLLEAAEAFEANSGKDVQTISGLLDNVISVANKVLIPLRMMSATSEEEAIAIKEDSNAHAHSLRPTCDAAALGSKVQTFQSYLSQLSKAAESLAYESLR